MKVGYVIECIDVLSVSLFLDSDELERIGIDLGIIGCFQLMVRFVEGIGLQILLVVQ